ncbi:DUF554 domain-containing protein [Desulfovibrio aminophilus]|nr:DUF554 domain-containing protein [Desulfovibrio aminophilus]MCM0755089.1 DUF554 domain-containing protein [Desulfovibrio aminophilus]
MLGPIVNSACIIFGAFTGSVCGRIISPEFNKKIILVFSCITMGIGVSMTAKGNSLPPVVISLLLGTLLGEACRIEAGAMRLAFRVVGFFRRGKAAAALPEQTFRDQFAVLTVLFCVSGLGIMGSMNEGMTGDPSLLLIKSLLDLPTALLFAANIGGVVAVLVVPQFLIQAAILLLATSVTPLTTPAMFADFSACGGIIMLGAALRQFGLSPVPVISMIPSLFLVMPISVVWLRLFA